MSGSFVVVTAHASITALGEGSTTVVPREAHGAGRIAVDVRAAWPDAPDRLGRMDRASTLALLLAHRVFESAGISLADREATGVVAGTALGCAETNEHYHRGLLAHGVSGASPLLFAQTIPSTLAGEIAIATGARGHTVTVMAGRASGIAALVEARRAIALGRCMRVLVVTGDVIGDDRLPLRTSPVGEAFVALVLEHPDAARVRGATVFARITEARTWYGAESDPPHGMQDEMDIDALGATGTLALAAWLDGGARGGLAVDVHGADGMHGRVRATGGARG